MTKCEGYRRYGGAFTLGPIRWEQCKKEATVTLTVEQEGEVSELPSCYDCWTEASDKGIVKSAVPLPATTLTEEEFHILKHSLTGSTVSGEWYRNYYATAPDCDGYDFVTGLVRKGLMRQGEGMPQSLGGMEYFHVTDEGKELVRKGK